jgi:1-acyl-sn-glycerol-3-phosphate acyltransferase
LRSLKILPVYRISEGAENLGHNYTTFDECKQIFRDHGIVLIFSEGKCVNEWHLRPLKKGTARLAISAWQDNIPLKVLPAGINYNSFNNFGKTIRLNFGEFILEKDICRNGSDGIGINAFNSRLENELQQLVLEIDKDDTATIRKNFSFNQPAIKKIILFIPFILGWLLHMPIYYPIKKFIWNKTAHNDHFDSILIGSLFFVYPFYLLFLSLIVYYFIGGWWWLLIPAIVPFCAWSYVQLKDN